MMVEVVVISLTCGERERKRKKERYDDVRRKKERKSRCLEDGQVLGE